MYSALVTVPYQPSQVYLLERFESERNAPLQSPVDVQLLWRYLQVLSRFVEQLLWIIAESALFLSIST